MRIAIVVVVLLGLAGCASHPGFSPSVSPAWTPEAYCGRDGGVWRAAISYCEPQFASAPR